ncbi:Cell Wall Hydrolase [uncultured archaeon]|nr:Cell Wall Hydrolase [uncultured archaeon]
MKKKLILMSMLAFLSLNARINPATEMISFPVMERLDISVQKRPLGRNISIENYITNDFKKDSEKVLLARMLLGEAEDCSEIEKVAIAYTALNRAKDKEEWNGETLKEVILKPNQYSCFNSGTDSNIFLKNPLKYNQNEFFYCLEISAKVLEGKYQDPTGGATYYYNPAKVKEPRWTKKLAKVGKIKNSYHIFYKKK